LYAVNLGEKIGVLQNAKVSGAIELNAGWSQRLFMTFSAGTKAAAIWATHYYLTQDGILKLFTFLFQKLEVIDRGHAIDVITVAHPRIRNTLIVLSNVALYTVNYMGWSTLWVYFGL
jgi:hypothetical protein